MVYWVVDISTSPQIHKREDILFSESAIYIFTSLLNKNVCTELMPFPFFKLSLKIDRQTPANPNLPGKPSGSAGLFRPLPYKRTLQRKRVIISDEVVDQFWRFRGSTRRGGQWRTCTGRSLHVDSELLYERVRGVSPSGPPPQY